MAGEEPEEESDNDPFAEIRLDLIRKGVPKNMLHQSEGENWLKANVEDGPARTALTTEFRTTFVEFVEESLAAMQDDAKALIKDLKESKLVLFELPTSWNAYIKNLFKDGRHFLGILMTVLLISLGAPFWYNMLRGLTNMRPYLASKEAAASKQEVKKRKT